MRDDLVMEILKKSPPTPPNAVTLVGQQIAQIEGDELAKILRSRHDSLVQANEFEPGNMIKWKLGLKHMAYPAYGKPAVVVEVLSEPVENRYVGPESAYFRELLDLRIGCIADDGGFYLYHVPSNRFEVY